jgi:hypothetical protein
LPFAASAMLSATTTAAMPAAPRITTGLASATHSASSSVAPSNADTAICSPAAGAAIPWMANAVKIAPKSSPNRSWRAGVSRVWAIVGERMRPETGIAWIG